MTRRCRVGQTAGLAGSWRCTFCYHIGRTRDCVNSATSVVSWPWSCYLWQIPTSAPLVT